MDPLQILAASRVNRFFSTGQATGDGVQSARPEQPAACGLTYLTIRCGHFSERGYTLALPLKTTRPNESPRRPIENTASWITQIPTDGLPVLEVLSSCDDVVNMDYLIVSAQGPAECPPGFLNQVLFQGGGNEGTKNLPFSNWQILTPAGLTADTWKTITGALVKNLHPLRLPELPAKVYEILIPGCLSAEPGIRHQAKIHAYPNVRWHGDYSISLSEEAMQLNQPYQVSGQLSVTWNEQTTQTSDWHVLRQFLNWHDLADVLKKIGRTFLSLQKEEFDGYHSSRLGCHPEFHWRDAPTMRVAIESKLFEQPGNGLIGHHVDLLLSASLGAEGEMNLLPLLATKANFKFITQPLVKDREKLEELCVRYGIFLRSQGRAALKITARGDRPTTDWAFAARNTGAMELTLEGRAEDEFTTIWIEASALEGPTAAPDITFRATPPQLPERQKSLLDHAFRADVQFSGIRLNALTTSKFGLLTTAEKLPDNEQQLAPPIAWPPTAKADEPPPEMLWYKEK